MCLMMDKTIISFLVFFKLTKKKFWVNSKRLCIVPLTDGALKVIKFLGHIVVPVKSEKILFSISIQFSDTDALKSL